MKGKQEVHKLCSAERGALITVVLAMSASGIFIPPMVIFPRKNRKNELSDDLPAESLVGYPPSGWITSQLFTQWFAHFVKIINSSKENPALLIFDGHFSHTRNLDVIDIARTNNVALVSLPPHTSGKTQPLDVSFMKSFKSYYARAVESWMDSHPGRILTHYSIGKLFNEAYEKAANIPIAVSGFRKTGIMPFNRNNFDDDPKLIKSRSCEEQSPQPSTSRGLPQSPSRPSTPELIVSTPVSINNVTPARKTSSTHVTPEDINPIPKLKAAPPSTRRQSSTLISSSPHKNKLIRLEEIRLKREEEKRVKALKKKEKEAEKSAKRAEKETKKLQREEKRKGKGKPAAEKKKEIRGKKAQQESESSSEGESMEDENYNDDDPECQFCGFRYSLDQHGQIWIKCQKCFTWAHEVCDAAVDECANKKKYICSFCLNA